MTTLILVESPNKVAHVTEYAEAAGVQPVKVLGTQGHLLDLPPMSEGLCVDLATWSPTVLAPKDDRAEARFAKIKAAIQSADRVLVATDGDREGEGIASEVWDLIPAAKARRCVFEEITPEGVRRGLQAQRDLSRPTVEAFRSRRLLDRLFGYHATQLTFEKLPAVKTSAGRVQSPALRLVVDRWKEFSAFKPVTTYAVSARLRHTATDGTAREFTARVLQPDGSRLSFRTGEEAAAVQLGSSLPCTQAEGREKAQKPKPPFTNSAWLQVAQKALKLPVSKASESIQSLFESGSTTYPRTDSVRVSEEAIAWAREELARRFGPDFVPAKPWEHRDKPGAQGAHEAIRPTIPHGERKHADTWEEAFRLIEARFLASQAAARRVQETVLRFAGPDGLVLEAKGQVELFPGWKRVLQLDEAEEEAAGTPAAPSGEEDDEDGALPPVRQGDQVEVLEVLPVKQTTKPPQLFTQASLVAELERRGIGRPSTFSAMVGLILARAFVEERAPESASPKGEAKKKAAIPVLVPTPTGIALSEFLVRALPEFLDYAWTAKIEEGLDAIEAGRLERPTFLEALWKRLDAALQVAKSSIEVQRQARKEFGPCPKCASEGRDGRLVLKKGRKADSQETFEFAGCSLDTKEAKPCGYRADTDNGELRAACPCPSCKSPMKGVRRKDGGHSWVCEAHGWHLASKTWELVPAQKCPDCRKAMQHRTNKDGDHFWGCFECKRFLDSDPWGAVKKPRSKAGRRPKVPA